MKLENKVAIVTGGAMGNGLGIVKVFLKYGAKVIIFDYSDKLGQTVEELRKQNYEVDGYLVDIRDKNKIMENIEKVVQKYGTIDILVNNAGITKDTLLMRMKEEDFDKVINVNLKGTYNVTKNVIPYMMKQKYGKIINISSVVGVSGNAGQANYAASKAGIIGFTKSVAKELASRNILANCVAPGFIKTDMTDVLSDSVKESINSQIPLKKMGTAEEVANAVYFLGNEENTYITGQVLNVDGGMLM